MNKKAMNKKVVVIGGGIVGVCAALEAQYAGFDVTLIDRGTPGRQTSFGNAGVLSESSVTVLNNPTLIKALPKLLMNRTVGFRYRGWFVLRKLGWFIKFLSYSTRRRTLYSARALRALMVLSLKRHKALIAKAGAGEIFRHQGWMKAFRTKKSFQNFKFEMQVMQATGVKYTVYDKEQIRQIEPALGQVYEKAVMLDETCGVSNPAKLTDAYVELFLAAGGKVIKANVSGLTQDKDGWAIDLEGKSSIKAHQVVLAAGAWSAQIAGWLGYDIPLLWERGYHRHLRPAEGRALNRAVHDVIGGFAMIPMQMEGQMGVRITTGVEMADLDAPHNHAQLDASIELARASHGFGEAIDDEPWMGCRPTLIDSLPMIDKAPRHKNLFFNFGHQHIGLSMATGSGQVIAALLKGKNPPIDISPFAATRFPI